jgi:type III secretory pathway component EscT
VSAVLEALFGADAERVLIVLLLVLARALPLAWVAPWLGWRGTASIVRAAVGIVLAVALTPIALASAPDLPASWPALSLMIVREVLVGIAFAIASSLPILALGWTGDLVDRWRGSNERVGPLGTLHLSAGVVLFVIVGGHRLAIAAFAEALNEAPVGAGASGAELSAFALEAARLVTLALELAVAFAAPAAIAFVIVELAIGLAGRVAPVISSLFGAVPLRAALGVAIALLGLSALLPSLPSLFEGSIDAALELVR